MGMCKEVKDKNSVIEEVVENKTDSVVPWANSRSAMLTETSSFELIPYENMELRVNQFKDKIQGILDYNSNLWKRQLEKVKEDEEKAKQRQEIDEQIAEESKS